MNYYNILNRSRSLSLSYMFFFLISVSFSGLQAQGQDQFSDKLVLKNGSIIMGDLQDYKSNGDILMTLKNGKSILFSAAIIQKVKMRKGNTNTFNDKSWFHNVNFSIQGGNNDGRNQYRLGTSFGYSAGYRFDRKLSVGIGTGWETYSVGTKEYFIPLYLELTSFLTNKSVSPFVKLQVGGAFSIVTNDFIEETSGGWYLYPSFGWRLNGSEDLNYTLDFGFKMQKANYLYRIDGWRGPTTREQDLVFRRFSFRFGILF